MKRKLSHIYTPYNILLRMFLCFFIFYFFNTQSNADEIISSDAAPVKIIDGDSLEIGDHRIRLQGIDAPEYQQYCKDKQNKKYLCGKESLEYLKKLVSGNSVRCETHKKDKYDRDLCTCHINDLNINAEMVRSGHAISYLDDTYNKEQTEAKKHKRGIWQGKFIHPRLFRRLKEQ